VWDIAKQYTDAFVADTQALNILPPTEMPRATQYIPEQIEMIQLLEKKGFTYTTADGVYFDTAKFPAYGAMARLDVAGLQEGARVEKNVEKRNATDFALWKFSPTGDGVAKRAMEWESPWGVGFPGWHIECSAMAKALLGETIDIHCGGVDHMPVHHTNEIAQSECANGVPFVRTWMHGEFLLINEGRMGKSEGNFITLSGVREKGFDPLAYRLFVLGVHYRSKLNFTWENIKKSQAALNKLVYTVSQWNKATEEDADVIREFETALQDDLNMPEAMAVVWELVKSERESGVKMATLSAMDAVLGLDIARLAGELRGKIAATGTELKELLEKRSAARASKDYTTSDAIRDQILKLGFVVEDTPEGQILRPQ
jgi:cysteinyl-tRNA synthetase